MRKKHSEDSEPLFGRLKEMVCPVSRRERRRTETRDRLFDAALRLLSEHEFDHVTVEMITEAADVGKGTFFNYFPNKEAIVTYYYEVQARLIEETLRAKELERAAAAPEDGRFDPRAGGPFWRKMVAIVQESAEKRDKNRLFTRTLLALALTNPAVRTANLHFRNQINEVICVLIEEAQNQSELRRDIPADTLADYMFQTYLGALYVWSQSDGAESLRDTIDRAYARVWSGIRHDGEPQTAEASGKIP